MNLSFDLSFSSPASPVFFRAEPLTPRECSLHETALARSSRYLESEAELLEAIMEVDQTRLYLKFDLGSSFAYCVKHLKLSEAVAYNFISVARKAKEVPQLKAAIEEGSLGVAKARKIVSVLTTENQQDWIEKATVLSQSKLEREVVEAAPANLRSTKARVRPIKNQKVKMEIEIPEETLTLWRRSQELLAGKISGFPSLEEALRWALEGCLDRHDPLRKAERVQARNEAKNEGKKGAKNEARNGSREPFVEKSERSLVKATLKRGTGGASLESGQPKVPTLPDGKRISSQLSHSMKRRKPLPAAVVHGVNLRDHGRCQARRADGTRCGATTYLHFHHILPVERGGRETVENLVTLCGSCHRRWHRETD